LKIHRHRNVRARAGRELRYFAAVGLAGSLCASGYLLSGASAHGVIRQSAGNAPVSLRTTQLGAILVNAKGHTLYLFTGDKSARSSCAGACAKYWPPAVVPAKPTGGAGVKAALLGTILRSDGRRQLTYNHHPLYGFSLDKQAGQANGQGSTAFGGQWWAVSSKGSPVRKRATAPSPTSTATSTNATTTESTTTYSRYP
jgi:predicted lipoprotein with Yx(FWY)xxD motif